MRSVFEERVAQATKIEGRISAGQGAGGGAEARGGDEGLGHLPARGGGRGLRAAAAGQVRLWPAWTRHHLPAPGAPTNSLCPS